MNTCAPSPSDRRSGRHLRPWLASGLLALVGCAPEPTAAPAPRPDPRPPALDLGGLRGDQLPRNLLILTLDTTRKDRLSGWSSATTSPFLAARRAEGVSLDDHWSCSNWTAPSMICATTGFRPDQLGFWPGTQLPGVPNTPDTLPSLARRLTSRGWQTHLVSANAVFSDLVGAGDGFTTEEVITQAPAEAVAALGLTALDRLQKDPAPWYLHLHFMDPHRPYCPPVAPEVDLPELGYDLCTELGAALVQWPEASLAWRLNLLAQADLAYQAEIQAFDLALEGLWAELTARGALEETLVVFWTDHGEQLMERGVMDHGYELYPEESAAAAFFWAKGLYPAQVTDPTLHQDLSETIGAVFGLEPTGGLALDARSPDRIVLQFAVSAIDGGPAQAAARSPRQAQHLDWAGRREVYDRRRDPGERRPLSQGADPDLQQALTPLVDALSLTWPALGPPPDP